MALADHPLAAPRKGPMCSVCALTESLEAEDRATLLGWLADPEIRYSAIQKAVRDEFGRDIATHTWAAHTRGSCAARVRLR